MLKETIRMPGLSPLMAAVAALATFVLLVALSVGVAQAQVHWQMVYPEYLVYAAVVVAGAQLYRMYATRCIYTLVEDELIAGRIRGKKTLINISIRTFDIALCTKSRAQVRAYLKDTRIHWQRCGMPFRRPMYIVLGSASRGRVIVITPGDELVEKLAADTALREGA